MRVLMLASYFPKPANPLMGNWALSQAQALLRAGLDVVVVSGTTWVPRPLALTTGARAYADCPAIHRWGGLTVYYPRWPLYTGGPLANVFLANPEPLMYLAWLTVQARLLKLVRTFQPDVVYAHHTQVNGYLAYQLKRISGIPYVITDHDFGEIDSCFRYPRRRRLFAKIAANSSCMVAVAARMEKQIQELFPSAPTMTVHNGTDALVMSAVEARPAELQDSLIVFCACHLYERKGVPLLVRAFSALAAKYPQARLRIAGDGAEKAAVEVAIRDAGLESRVVLLGRQSHERVLQEMSWCDVFALPGWDEPFATVFSEAMSAGRPIIYSADGGFADVACHGVHGLSVEPRSEESLRAALDALLSSKSLRKTMGDAGRALFEAKLRWDHNAARMRTLFQSA